MLEITKVEKIVLAVLRRRDEEIAATVTDLGPDHPLGIFEELHTKYVLLLLSPHPVVVQLLMLCGINELVTRMYFVVTIEAIELIKFRVNGMEVSG